MGADPEDLGSQSLADPQLPQLLCSHQTLHSPSIMSEFLQIFRITIEQTWIMVWKNLQVKSSLTRPHMVFQQKRLVGRTTLKEYLIPVFLLAFWIFFTQQNNSPTIYADPVYSLRNLPPLSDQGKWGIFQDDDVQIDVSMFVQTKLLLYTPNNHQGVNDLMEQLAIAYPQVDIRGEKTSGDVDTEYEANLFSTWGAIEFELTDDQITTGKLITSSVAASDVSYKLRICPTIMVSLPFPLCFSASLPAHLLPQTLPDSTRDEDAYRDGVASADAWINSGYLTIQNFIATYLATQYPGVPSNFTVHFPPRQFFSLSSPLGGHLRPEISKGPLPTPSSWGGLCLFSFHALEMGCKFSFDSLFDFTAPYFGLNDSEGERKPHEGPPPDLWSDRCGLLGQLPHLWRGPLTSLDLDSHSSPSRWISPHWRSHLSICGFDDLLLPCSYPFPLVLWFHCLPLRILLTPCLSVECWSLCLGGLSC
jgi:hypothetical protein